MDATVLLFVLIALAVGVLIGWLLGSREAAGAKQALDHLRLQLEEVLKERDANRFAAHELAALKAAGEEREKAFQQQIEAYDLVGQRLPGLVVQLASYPLALALLCLKHSLGAEMSLAFQPIEHGVEDGRDPAHVRVGVARVDPRFVHIRFDRAHHRFQLPERPKGEPQDQEVHHQDGKQPNRQQQQERGKPGTAREVEGDQGTAQGADGDDGAVSYRHLLKGGEISVPGSRVEQSPHS